MNVENINNRLYTFATSFVDNRVFDLYLKYLGITTLTPATLVPVALILGQDTFRSYLSQVKRGQVGGKLKIPIIDSPDIGTYLKLIGLYHLNLTPHTLIPLGVLMVLYELNRKQLQLGGGNNPSDVFYKFARKMAGNRVLDLYLKYKGIVTLTSYTLVPIALILGKDAFEKYVNKTKNIKTPTTISQQLSLRPNRNIKLNQMGGKLDLPIVDDPLIGNYLKLAGLYHLPLTSGTLVPLGILMIVYNIYGKQLNL